MLSEDQIIDAIQSLPDRYVPRFEVFFAKPEPFEEKPGAAGSALLDPEAALVQEKQRLSDRVFREVSGPNPPPPKLSQLIPLAGPWGEKQGQRTDDIVSITFTESVEKNLPLSSVSVELLNVYDPARRFYRYTDIPADLLPDRTGVYPLVDYGDTLAVRIGYGAGMDWVFAGVVNQVDVDFPANGESRIKLVAVDKRDRLRSKNDLNTGQPRGASEEELIAQVAQTVGLRVAAVAKQTTKTTGAGRRRPSDQDPLQYITDRAKRAALELLCFSDVLLVLKPADEPRRALRYQYRRGLTSFKPSFNGAGKPTRVRVHGRNTSTGERFTVEVGTSDLQQAGLIPVSSEGSVADQVKSSGQSGERVEVVTNYLARSAEEAKRIAIGVLKRSVDETIEVEGSVVGDPRLRARETLRIDGVGRFSGFYYVTRATHQLGLNGYQTTFKARRTLPLNREGAAGLLQRQTSGGGA